MRSRMSWAVLVSMLAAGMLWAGTAFAGMTGHYSPGLEGIRCGTPPPPGFTYKMYNMYYKSDTLRDGNGDKLNVGFDAKIFANCHRFIYNTNVEILGGTLGMDFVVPILYQDLKIDAFGVSDSQTGVCDLFIEPFAISWVRPRFEGLVSLGLWVPTGKFEATDSTSPGKGFYTGMLTFGGTYFFDEERTWAASVLGHYEVNGEQQDTNVTPGNCLTLEWGVSKNLAKIFDVGVVGYGYWQLSDDDGAGVRWDAGVHGWAYAVGPEVSVFIPPAKLTVSLRQLFEFGVEDRPEGMTTVLSLVKLF